jgi:tRNA dimethylallyltransferase
MKLIILLGPTASGKSEIALSLLEKNPSLQIINCDSKQIYKEIPVITAQPSKEEISQYGHLLYSHKTIFDHYDVKEWKKEAFEAIKKSFEKGKIPFLIGGTGFYVKTLLNGIDEMPEISAQTRILVKEKIKNEREEIYKILCRHDLRHFDKINFNDSYRLEKAALIFFETGKSIFEFYDQKNLKQQVFGSELRKFFPDLEIKIFVLNPSKEILYEKINSRFDFMINEMNLIEEIRKIKILDPDKNLSFYKTHGVPEIFDFLDEKINFNEMSSKTKQNIRNYAKRQITWTKNQIEFKEEFCDKNAIKNLIQDFIIK